MKGEPSVTPDTVEAARAALAEAAAAGRRVRAEGGGRFAWLGGTPPPADVILRTVRLARAVFYEPQELVVKVEAGMTVAALQATLGAAGQEMAWDEPWPDQQTVGGVVAAGLAGPRRMSCGAPRDHVLGVTLLLPDGVPVRPGGRVVKNVAGYDLTRLAVGSRGALGVIVEACLRTRPLPELAWAATARYPSPAELFEGARAVLGAGAFPSFLEARGVGGRFELATGAEGAAEQVAAQREALRAALGRGRDLAEREQRGVRELLRDWARAPWAGDAAVVRVAVPRSRLGDVVAGSGADFHASAGAGTARLVLPDARQPEAARDALAGLHAVASAHGGWAAQDRGPLSREDGEPLAPGVRRLNDAVRAAFAGAA